MEAIIVILFFIFVYIGIPIILYKLARFGLRVLFRHPNSPMSKGDPEDWYFLKKRPWVLSKQGEKILFGNYRENEPTHVIYTYEPNTDLFTKAILALPTDKNGEISAEAVEQACLECASDIVRGNNALKSYAYNRGISHELLAKIIGIGARNYMLRQLGANISSYTR